jgi:hypothetical protein
LGITTETLENNSDATFAEVRGHTTSDNALLIID